MFRIAAEEIAFIFVFVPIRRYLGGLHLGSSEFCMICSVAFNIANGIMVIDLIVIIFCRKMGFTITPALVLLDICAVLFYFMAKVKMWLELGSV